MQPPDSPSRGTEIETIAPTTTVLAPTQARRLEAILIAAAAGLAVVGCGWAIVTWPIDPVAAPSLALVLDTVATVVTLTVAGLAWVHYRECDEPVALFLAAAFAVLALAHGSSLVLQINGCGGASGCGVTSASTFPTRVDSRVVITLAHLLAAGLIVTGILVALGRHRPHRAMGPLAAAGITTGLGLAALPLVGLGGPALAPAVVPLSRVMPVFVAGAYLWAAILSHRLYRRDASIAIAYLAVGLVFASGAQVADAIVLTHAPGAITTGDVLRLGFDFILLLGILAQAHVTLDALSEANADLARLRATDVERAGLTERMRLSRELHDGLAQNLWLAKLKVARLAAIRDLGEEARALTGELAGAIEAGLVDAQHAVATMRLSGEPSGSLEELLSRSVDEFGDRFGVRAEFECPSELPALPPRAQAEALRIAQEALSNVRRHADATVVRVRAFVDSGRIVVAVRDNGRGFDPEAVGENAFGLLGMRERAALIGGELSIESAPSDGTRVSLAVPLPVAAAAAGAAPT